MKIQEIQAVAKANFSRFNPNSTKGFYESFFVRANHPTKRQAFWIRYTLFAPKGLPHKRLGELWGIFFDQDQIYPFKKELPLENCQFPNKHFYVKVGDSSINSANAVGQIDEFQWDLQYKSEEQPLFLLPLHLYNTPFPKAKSIVSQPLAHFNGRLQIGDRSIDIQDWVGSQNHNWGLEHTNHYAWGQVAGFDNSPTTFLEIITAKVSIGNVNTPFITLLTLRHNGKTYALNNISEWVKNKGSFDYFDWTFECQTKEVEIKGRIKAKASDFVGLRYLNPPKGHKHCLNSKVASCELQIKETKQVGMPTSLYTANRCAFEILTNDTAAKHGIEINF